MRRRAGPSLPLLAALLAAAAVCAAAVPQVSPVMAIDLGAEFLKLSIVKPGRIPISVVINEMSKRKTPALVAFVDGDRLVGEEAAAVAARFPDRVYGRLLDLLGRPADNPQLTAMLKASYRPYTLERAPNRTSPAAAAVRTGDELRSAEELVASLLEYAKGLAEAAADGAAVTDAVLTVPASFTIQQVCTAGVGVGEGGRALCGGGASWATTMPDWLQEGLRTVVAATASLPLLLPAAVAAATAVAVLLCCYSTTASLCMTLPHVPSKLPSWQSAGVQPWPRHSPPASWMLHHLLLQRQALLDAAKLAGLNVLGLIHSHAGAGGSGSGGRG